MKGSKVPLTKERRAKIERGLADATAGRTSPLSDVRVRLGIEAPKREAVHEYFGLTYSNYLVLHRTVLQSLPDSVQTRLVAILREIDERVRGLETAHGYHVHAVDAHGRYIADPIPHYRRGRERVDLKALAGDACEADGLSDGRCLLPHGHADAHVFTRQRGEDGAVG